MALDDPDDAPFRPPLPPDDRIWRHPSELAPTAAAGPRRRPAPQPWLVAIVSGLAGAILATGLVALGDGLRDRPAAVERVVERRAEPASTAVADGPASVATVAERVTPAIVQLLVEGSDGRSSGSGVIFRSDGHILTNEHVVSGASRVSVVLSDGRRLDGRVVGGDADTDIAVVKVGGGPYPTAVLGSATALRAGDTCIAIGSPLGLAGGPSVSVGVLSALGRFIDADDHRLYDMIQTDAAISPGSSGGALLDRGGNVIGITTAIAVSDAGAEGLGFATPIDIAHAVAEELISTGKATHVWLGVEGSDVDQERAEELGIAGGAAIKRVIDGSPAAAAGLRSGDVVVEVAGTPVSTMAGLVVALRSRKVGDRVGITYRRGDATRTATVVLAERPANLPER